MVHEPALLWQIRVPIIIADFESWLVQTDGKAARNLLKLQLFRQFYVMVVVYIYFTRIVVYLLRSTMPYQYAWLPDAAGNSATFLMPSWDIWPRDSQLTVADKHCPGLRHGLQDFTSSVLQGCCSGKQVKASHYTA